MAWGEFKDTAGERRLFQRRALVMLALVLVVLGGLLTRMYQLQVIEHDIYTTLSDKNRVQVQSVPPPRGLIYDRNNLLLAENRPVFSITVVPERVDNMPATLAGLRDILTIPEEDMLRFERRLNDYRRPFEAIPLSYDLSEQEIAKMAVRRHEFPGVEVTAELVRHYPHSELTAHALGYVSRINREELQRIDSVNYAGTNYIGKSGIERFYEDVLHGSVGYQHVETNARGRILRVLEQENPVPGEDLQLHLDLRMQRKAHELLEGRRGTIIAIEPATGGIIALASVPSFDANKFVTGIGSEEYRELSTSIDKPLFNRALRGQYPPGSTIKPMMAVAALDSETTTRDYQIYDPGYFQLNDSGRRWRDWKRSGHGWVNLMDSVAESCDVYFYEMGVKMGVDTMHRYLSAFGFGEDATLDVAGALEGILPSREWKRAHRNEPWYPGDSVNMSIGQGFFLATPLQLATATALIANRGRWVEPRLLRDIPGDRPVEGFLPESTHQPLELKNPNDWEYVVDTMEEVMHGRRGTARRAAAGASYRMAGKTGTAQVFSLGAEEEYEAEDVRERLRDHALFVGFAPSDKPQIAVAVIVENGGGGSSVAAPVARELFDTWLEDLPASESDSLIGQTDTGDVR